MTSRPIKTKAKSKTTSKKSTVATYKLRGSSAAAANDVPRTGKSVQSGSKKNTGKSGITQMVYETADDLYQAGSIDKITMRQFDHLCLPKIPNYSARQIKAIRARCNLSQQLFAAFLNVSPSALQKWERGDRKPDGLALKLLSLVDKKGIQGLL